MIITGTAIVAFAIVGTGMAALLGAAGALIAKTRPPGGYARVGRSDIPFALPH